MKLVFIYGPPAVGKLTVAKELAALTGFKVFHNHLTFDLAEALFPFGTRPFGELIECVRMKVFELAAESDTDLIFTMVYAARHDDLWIRDVMDLIEDKGGSMHLVRLACPCDTLEERVVLPDRKQFGKLASVESLRVCLGKWDLFSPMPFGEHLCIDTSSTEPGEAARKIVEAYSLRSEK
jgi:chloramphenicol 3-O-phosphotransferase